MDKETKGSSHEETSATKPTHDEPNIHKPTMHHFLYLCDFLCFGNDSKKVFPFMVLLLWFSLFSQCIYLQMQNACSFHISSFICFLFHLQWFPIGASTHCSPRLSLDVGGNLIPSVGAIISFIYRLLRHGRALELVRRTQSHCHGGFAPTSAALHFTVSPRVSSLSRTWRYDCVLSRRSCEIGSQFLHCDVTPPVTVGTVSFRKLPTDGH